MQIVQNAILKKAFYWDQLCKTTYRYVELCSSNVRGEKWGREGCEICIPPRMLPGWNAACMPNQETFPRNYNVIRVPGWDGVRNEPERCKAQSLKKAAFGSKQ